MQTNTHTFVSRWLTNIMPDVTAALTSFLTEDDFVKMGEERGVFDPVTINIEELNGPITAIKFYFIVVEPTMSVAATLTFKEVPDDYTPTIRFNMVFDMERFADDFNDEENLQLLVDTLMQQYQNLFDEQASPQKDQES